MDNMFTGCSNNLLYCINYNSKTTKLLSHINDVSYNYNFKSNNNCSDDYLKSLSYNFIDYFSNLFKNNNDKDAYYKV